MSFMKKNQKIKIPKEYEGPKLRRLPRNNIDQKNLSNNNTQNILENNIIRTNKSFTNDVKDIYKPIYIPNITKSDQKNLPMYPEFLNKTNINGNNNNQKNNLSHFYKGTKALGRERSNTVSTITNKLNENFYDLREILLSIDPKLIGCPIIATDSIYNMDNTVNVILTFNKNSK